MIQSHQIRRNITAPTRRFKAKRLLEIPENKFTNVDLFEATDGSIVGVISANESRTSNLERLGWTRCDELNSFVKFVLPDTTVADVMHRRLADIVALNFDHDPTSFVTETDLYTWFHNVQDTRLWKNVLGIEMFGKFVDAIDRHIGPFRTRKSVETEILGAATTKVRERCWLGWRLRNASPVLDETSMILAYF
jgi:hypothetical protein